MRCRIHRGCHEIGGNCVEIESQGKRIVLDIGLPLKSETEVGLPEISGLAAPDESLLGIVISHPHADHFGLLEQIPSPVPIYIGEAARRIIDVGGFFTRLPGLGRHEPNYYAAHQPLTLGPFTITPLPIDHSAFDSYCLLIEAEGKRVFYSGDLRAHGHQADYYHRIVENPPPKIDVLICEGTRVGRIEDFPYPDEGSVARKMADLFQETKGMCLVWCSAQNVDRVVSAHRAAKAAGRQLILDMYTAEVLRAANGPLLPRPGEEGVKVFLPSSQRSKIKRERAFDISDPYKPHRIYETPYDKRAVSLRDAAPKSVMIFRPSMYNDLRAAECLDSALLVGSLWSGYIKQSMRDVQAMQRAGIRFEVVHTSGHATEDALQRFVNAFPDSRVVPIHLEDREGFGRLSPKLELRNDFEWWEV
jgi:ribonuclease J